MGSGSKKKCPSKSVINGLFRVVGVIIQWVVKDDDQIAPVSLENGSARCHHMFSFDFHFVMSLFKVLDPTLGTRGHTCQSFSRAIV